MEAVDHQTGGGVGDVAGKADAVGDRVYKVRFEAIDGFDGDALAAGGGRDAGRMDALHGERPLGVPLGGGEVTALADLGVERTADGGSPDLRREVEAALDVVEGGPAHLGIRMGEIATRTECAAGGALEIVVSEQLADPPGVQQCGIFQGKLDRAEAKPGDARNEVLRCGGGERGNPEPSGGADDHGAGKGGAARERGAGWTGRKYATAKPLGSRMQPCIRGV